MVENASFPQCCSVMLQYGFWETKGQCTYPIDAEKAYEFFKKNEIVEHLNTTQLSIIVLREDQYEVLKEVLNKFKYKVVEKTKGNSRRNIYVLIKNTKEARRANSL